MAFCYDSNHRAQPQCGITLWRKPWPHGEFSAEIDWGFSFIWT